MQPQEVTPWASREDVFLSSFSKFLHIYIYIHISNILLDIIIYMYIGGVLGVREFSRKF